MTATVEAIYEEGGILRLLAPIPLQAGERVQVVLNNESPVPGDFDPQRALEAIMSIAAMPIEPGGEVFSGEEHDRILYGPRGAR